MVIVKRNWQADLPGKPMFKVWSKLKRLKPDLREITRKITNRVHNIQNCRDHLEKAQKLLNSDLLNTEYIKEVKIWTEELMYATNIEEKIRIQKSKLNWMQKGDANTTYFHAIIKGKNKQTNIIKLMDPNGNQMTDTPKYRR